MRFDRAHILGTAQALAPFILTGLGFTFTVLPSQLLVRCFGAIAIAAGGVWLLGEALATGNRMAYEEAAALDNRKTRSTHN